LYSEANITDVAGAGGLTYAKNKNRGGRSSAKGRDFEIVYGAFRIALEAAEAIKTGALGADISFHDQVCCFVDDFVTTRPTGRTFAQLKSGGASWTGGEHALADDFRLQAKLDSHCGVPASYELVVGDDARRTALIEAQPSDLSAVSVISFPGELPDLELINELDALATALAELSPRSDERIVREQVWRMLMGTWQSSRGDKTLAEIINAAATGPGAIVAPMLPAYELPTPAKKALDKVGGLRFYVQKNFLTYEALGGKQRGVADYHCHTPQFEAFMAELIEQQPTDFFSFWTIFKAHI
jgi:hypothetical protein